MLTVNAVLKAVFAEPPFEHIPNYVDSRYNANTLTKIQLGKLAMRAQYVAGEVLRGLSQRRFAYEISEDKTSKPRANFDY